MSKFQVENEQTGIDAVAVQNAVRDFELYLRLHWQAIPNGSMPVDVADKIAELVDRYAGKNTTYFDNRLNDIWDNHICSARVSW